MFSVSYPADEKYFSAVLENSVQVVADPRSIVNLYAFNNGAVAVYLLVQDNDAGPDPLAAATPGTVYPIAAKGYVSLGNHGGDQHKNGLYVGAYLTAAAAIAGGAPDAGNVMLYKIGWNASKITPQ